jgi:putative membrane protein
VPNFANSPMRILLHWFLSALAIVIVAYLLPGVSLSGFLPALVLAVVLGLINAVLRPLLLILTLPINVLSLGLFTLVINGLLIELAGVIVPGFHVRSFWWAMLFSIVLFLVNWIIKSVERPVSGPPGV